MHSARDLSILVDRKHVLRHLRDLAITRKRTCEAALLELEITTLEKEITTWTR